MHAHVSVCVCVAAAAAAAVAAVAAATRGNGVGGTNSAVPEARMPSLSLMRWPRRKPGMPCKAKARRFYPPPASTVLKATALAQCPPTHANGFHRSVGRASAVASVMGAVRTRSYVRQSAHALPARVNVGRMCA